MKFLYFFYSIHFIDDQFWLEPRKCMLFNCGKKYILFHVKVCQEQLVMKQQVSHRVGNDEWTEEDFFLSSCLKTLLFSISSTTSLLV